MAKLTLANVVNLQNETTAVNTINNNSDLVEAAIENTLSRDGSTPNSMGADLDMNSNAILNLPLPVTDTEPVRKGEFDVIAGSIEDVSEAVSEAEAAAQNAQAAQSATESLLVDAQDLVQDAEDAAYSIYLGPLASDPTLDHVGNPVVEGMFYFNTVSDALKVYDGASWISYSAATGLTAVVDDTSPTLGGSLDGGGFDITNLDDITCDDIAADVVTVTDLAYDATSWNGSLAVPTRNAVRDEMELKLAITTAGSTYQPLDSDLTSWAGVTRASGFDTFAATPSSANLDALVTDDTGSGALVFATSPTLVTPVLGTPSSGTLTSCTGLPAAGVVNTALTVAGEDQGPLTGGAYVTPKDLGTQTTGTLTVDPADRPMQFYINGGAHTLGELSREGMTVVWITNNGSAGAITTSGWDKVDGDAFTTTNAHIFRVHMERTGTYSYMYVRSMQ